MYWPWVVEVVRPLTTPMIGRRRPELHVFDTEKGARDYIVTLPDDCKWFVWELWKSAHSIVRRTVVWRSKH